jgi:feruloyl esterase
MQVLMLLFVSAQVQAVTSADCEGLVALSRQARLPNASTVIQSARLQLADEKSTGAGILAHCEVIGAMDKRAGMDGRRYAIRFHLRMPSTWNGRFFFEGGGATNGNLGDAMGDLQGKQSVTALALGYAVVSQDSGHDNAVAGDPGHGGMVAFGFDPRARLDYGYRSYVEVTHVAKALIRAYYGRGPDRSYFVGCSEGGREGMMMSQRYPDEFDGVLAVAPGLRLPKASLVGETWDSQALAAVARAAGKFDRDGLPLLNKTFTNDDLALVSSEVLAACDALDGLEDGIVDDFPDCTSGVVRPRLAARTCVASKTDQCLTSLQIAALHRIFDGARNARGELLYAGWPWDAGIGDSTAHSTFEGWRRWKLGTFESETNDAINVTLGATAAAVLFSTPPQSVNTDSSGFLALMLERDLERDFAAMHAKATPFDESAWEFMMASATDLSRFARHGGRLVIVHGVSDPVFSINDTIAWWKDVDAVMDGRAADVVRLFAVPGMAHCGTGPCTDRFDAFQSLVRWVEHGAPPDRIVATARETTPWPNRSRPLCAFPKQARYRGAGSIEEAASFECR